jgi:hypothetical protein
MCTGKPRSYGAVALLLMLSAFAGCSSLAEDVDTGVVIARRAHVRSSTAVVAADLYEVERGDQLDILGSEMVENNESWVRVRAYNPERTEGWIESRYVMSSEMLRRSQELAEEDEDTPSQATGQLRASTNLRISPDRMATDNIMMKLDSGSEFDIVGWKRVPKPKQTEETESDDAPKPAGIQRGSRRARQNQETRKADDTEQWYKVRLSRAISPAPAGWVYGKQVELKVPSDIIFYRTGREFVGWQRLDEPKAKSQKSTEAENGPGSWVVLEKSHQESRATDGPDFDRIYVLAYNKGSQEHYTAYRSNDVSGYLPVRIENQGSAKFIVAPIKADDGKIKNYRFKVSRDNEGLIRIEAPKDLPRAKRR